MAGDNKGKLETRSARDPRFANVDHSLLLTREFNTLDDMPDRMRYMGAENVFREMKKYATRYLSSGAGTSDYTN